MEHLLQDRLERIHETNTTSTVTATESVSQKSSPSEADSASGPPVPVVHSNSAPSSVFRARIAPPSSTSSSFHPRRLSMGDVTLRPGTTPPIGGTKRDVRRYVMYRLS